MEDFTIFMLGLLATTMAIGPLVIAMIADIRENGDEQDE